VNVLVDTSVWSLALRRARRSTPELGGAQAHGWVARSLRNFCTHDEHIESFP
jgi:hypothetical protein